jgi:NTE family protein
MRPARLSGSSAGALVGGLWASGRDGEGMGEELRGLRRAEFWDPGPGAGLLRGERFLRRLERTLDASTFEACRAPLAVSVHGVRPWGTEVVSSGALAPAVVASCAVPGLFQPVRLGERWYVDGGVSDRPGLAGMPAGERLLYHHLASRSPWRRPGSPSMAIPSREGLVSLVIEGLTRLGPFRLERGPAAFREAREATLRALEQRPVGGQVRVVARGVGMG